MGGSGQDIKIIKWQRHVIFNEHGGHDPSTSPKDRCGREKNLYFVPKCMLKILTKVILKYEYMMSKISTFLEFLLAVAKSIQP